MRAVVLIKYVKCQHITFSHSPGIGISASQFQFLLNLVFIGIVREGQRESPCAC